MRLEWRQTCGLETGRIDGHQTRLPFLRIKCQRYLLKLFHVFGSFKHFLIFLDNLNIENVFMGVVRNILVNMPLERPPDPSGDASSVSVQDLSVQPGQSGCSC